MPVRSRARQQRVVGDRRAEGADAPSAQVLEPAEAAPIGLPNGQDLAELEVGHRGREALPPGRRVLDAGHPDVEIAARGRSVDRGKGDLHEQGLPPEAPGDRLGDLDVEAPYLRRLLRVGLDERSSSFGVAAPAQHRRLRCCEQTKICCYEKQISSEKPNPAPSPPGRGVG